MLSWSCIRAAAIALLCLAAQAHADEPLGHRPTTWASKEFARHRQAAMRFADAYRAFLGRNKTEREVASAAVDMARKQGFRDLFATTQKAYTPGTRLHAVAHDKLVALVIIGKKPLDQGLHVVASHIDSVRIDVKQNPLYADGNAAWLETHYYGSIKPYQWLSQPLELRGVVVTRSGKTVDIAIGDDADEPVLVIPDLAVHLSHRVDAEEGEEVPAEALDPIVASTPAASVKPGQDPFAAEAARVLEESYGIGVGDLVAAELELVPAAAPRDVGIDRALIGGYGQDDRACAYAALQAIFDVKTPAHTAVVMLVDREEVGSAGNTAARSSFLRRVVAELIEGAGQASTELAVDRVLSSSMVMSADVTGAANAQYPSLYEPRNATFLGAGVAWDRSAVHAEVMAYVRTLLDQNKIAHQPSMWGKSERSSSGDTVLSFFTQHGMTGLDVSIPLLSMHAPFELVSKADLYEAFRAYRAFLAD